MNREIIQKTEKAYFESKMDSIFDIDECSHRRIVQQIGLIVSRKDTQNQNKRYIFFLTIITVLR